jgi:hypothetical protein
LDTGAALGRQYCAAPAAHLLISDTIAALPDSVLEHMRAS